MEQIFAGDGDDHVREREQFLGALLAASQPPTRLLLVLVLRADFRDKFYDYPELVEGINRVGAQFLVRGMTEEELQEAIVQPARDAGLELDSGLPDRLLRDSRHPLCGRTTFDSRLATAVLRATADLAATARQPAHT